MSFYGKVFIVYIDALHFTMSLEMVSKKCFYRLATYLFTTDSAQYDCHTLKVRTTTPQGDLPTKLFNKLQLAVLLQYLEDNDTV